MISDTVNVSDCEEIQQISQSQTDNQNYSINLNSTHQQSLISIPTDIRIVDYSNKAIAVYGDTKKISHLLVTMGGYFNARLKEGAGWIFSKNKKAEIEALFSTKTTSNNNNSKPEINTDFDLLSFLKQAEAENSQAIVSDTSNIITAQNRTTPIETSSVKNYADYIPSQKERDWINKLTNMRSMHYNGYLSPHKPILLLAIIKLIQTNRIKDYRIYPNFELEKEFIRLWEEHIPSTWPFGKNMYQPFIHLSGEDFYKIIWKDEIPTDLGIGWNRRNTNRVAYHSLLDDELYELFKNKHFTEILKEKLSKKYFEQNPSESKILPQLSEAHLDDFKKFLTTSRTSTGAFYSAATIYSYTKQITITNYIDAAEIKDIQKSSLEELNLDELNILLETITNLSSNGLITAKARNALRAYINFRESEKTKLAQTLHNIEQETDSLIDESNDIKETEDISGIVFQIKPTPDQDLPILQEYWINQLCNMQYNLSENPKDAYKPLFLLALIECIESGEIDPNKIFPYISLEKKFSELWNKFEDRLNNISNNMFNGYIELNKEQFYNIAWKDNSPNYIIDKWNRHKVYKYAYFGKIDKELIDLLRDQTFVKSVKEAIIKRYFSEDNISIKNYYEQIPIIIEENKTNNKSTFIEYIKTEDIEIRKGGSQAKFVEFINKIGPKTISNLNLIYRGEPLVKKGQHLNNSFYSLYLKNGYWLNTHNTTATKVDIIKLICAALGIEVEVSVW